MIASIVVATSIPPTMVRHTNGCEIGQEYQRHCIESWFRAGFRVISINFPDEIPALARLYPEVNFVEVDNRAASFNKKTPLLSDILNVLADQAEDIVGIINADIFLEAKDWADVIGSAVQGAIAVAHRADVTSLNDNNPTLDDKGYDVFFFERRQIPIDFPHIFAMGLPMWDFYLPIDFRMRGLRINLINSPLAFHLSHPTNWSWLSFRSLNREFAEIVVKSTYARPTSLAGDLLPVIKLCRKVAAGPSLRARAWDKLAVSTKHLPALWRLSKHLGQDGNLRRLSRACVKAISTY